MLRHLGVFVAGLALLAGLPAEARFGKGGSRSSSSSSSSSSHFHSSAPAGNSGSSGNAGSGSRGYSSYSGSYGYGYRPHWSLGFGFVPAYRYGYAPSAVVATEQPQPEQSNIRVTAGAEAHGFSTGFTLGVAVGVEGDRWGFVASGQNISVKADDGTNGFDNLQVATAHLTYAILAGEYGRLRIEGGADAVFAPNLIVIGPTAGLSAVVWVGGPFALEGSVMVTPWPFNALDGKIGAAIGLGPVGIRAGFRAQLLDDRGLVDGVVHRDLFLGPYVGVAFVF